MLKGPLAIYFGGSKISSQILPMCVKNLNISFYFLAVLSLILQFMLAGIKKYKFKNEAKYEDVLRNTVMSGVRNLYDHIIVFLVFLVLLLCFGIHIFLSKKHELGEEKNDWLEDDDRKDDSMNYSPHVMFLLLASMNLIPYKNLKLR